MAIPAQEIILPGDFEVSVALGADRTPTIRSGQAAITGSAAKHSAAEMIKSFIAWPFGRSADYGFAM
jgi:hypothetical protein